MLNLSFGPLSAIWLIAAAIALAATRTLGRKDLVYLRAMAVVSLVFAAIFVVPTPHWFQWAAIAGLVFQFTISLFKVFVAREGRTRLVHTALAVTFASPAALLAIMP